MAASMQESYDSAFLGILQHEGNIQSFLDVVFGFLYRRTDYYRIMKSKDDKLGFPPGVALKLAVKAFQKYAEQAEKDDELRNKLQGLQNLKENLNANEREDAITERKLEEELVENSYGHYCLCVPRSDADIENLYTKYGSAGEIMNIHHDDRNTFVFYRDKNSATETYLSLHNHTDIRTVREKLIPEGTNTTTTLDEQPLVVGGSKTSAKPAQASAASGDTNEPASDGGKEFHLVCENFPYKTHFKDLFKAFRPLGKVKVDIINNNPPKQTYAVVTFNDEAAVQSALTYDGEIFNGQEMRIRRFDPNLPKDQAYHAIASEEKTTRTHNKSRMPVWTHPQEQDWNAYHYAHTRGAMRGPGRGGYAPYGYDLGGGPRKKYLPY